jgi:hypothetical protein
MFGMTQEDFDNIKKLKEMPQEEQDKIIDEALDIVEKEKE